MIPQTPIPASLWNTVLPEAQAAISALVGSLAQRIAELEAENAELRRPLEKLEHDPQKIHQRKTHTQKERTDPKAPRADRRRKAHRKHPGYFRPEPPPGTEFTEHDVRPPQCYHCGAKDLEPTGQFEDHFVADLPEPQIQW